jgi:hypothetical protein
MTYRLMVPQENFPAKDTAICQVDSPPSLIVNMDRDTPLSQESISAAPVFSMENGGLTFFQT